MPQWRDAKRWTCMSLLCSNVFKKFWWSRVVPQQKLEQVLNSVKKHKAGTEIFLYTGLTKEKEDYCMLTAAPEQVGLIKPTDLVMTVLSPWPQLVQKPSRYQMKPMHFCQQQASALRGHKFPQCPWSEYSHLQSYKFIPAFNFVHCADCLWIHKSLRTVA